MALVIVGVLLLILHFAGVGAIGGWNFEVFGDLWKFVTPFALALAWWGWADASGMTRRREMDRDEERKASRRRRNIDAMGLGPKPKDGGSKSGRH
jgi:small Trp-rich protein